MNNPKHHSSTSLVHIFFYIILLVGCTSTPSNNSQTTDTQDEDNQPLALPSPEPRDDEPVEAIIDSFPLVELPDDAERDYWLPVQVNKPGFLDKFQRVVTSGPNPYLGELEKPLQIAFIYPSNDVSDFWSRNYLATIGRLDVLGIAYETTEFSSRQIEHELQTTYTTQILENPEFYDYVIFGPSNLSIQAENLNLLAARDEFKTFVWAFHTPLKSLENQPDLWFDFSSASGAQVICDYVLQRFGDGVTFAANRGIPDVTDMQRSGDFIDCVTEKGDWSLAYEHYGEYLQEGGYEGTKFIMENYPDVMFIHNANTAMAMGSVEAQVEAGMEDVIFATGWGGTFLELESIRFGKLDATPMRMGDDIGVATAEAIRADLEGRIDQLPKVYLGRMVVAHNDLGEGLLTVLEQEAFRYSGFESDEN